jgi:D-alanine-D-alanine ligase
MQPLEGPGRIHVYVPHAETARGLESPYYDYPEFRADLASWIGPLDLDWLWVPVAHSTLDEVVRLTLASQTERPTVVLNLCDGDDFNGYPGLSVIRALAAAGIAFTGADESFYALSTSKTAMKRRFDAFRVATSPWARIGADTRLTDLRKAARRIGYPLFVKPDVSFAAAGISLESLVEDEPAALARIDRVLSGMHSCDFGESGVFVERFLPGREFTVLVAADPQAPGGLVAWPGERRFHPALDQRERFITYERHSGVYVEDPPLADGAESYSYAPVPPEIDTDLNRLAKAAFRAVDGVGYARVDCKQDADGRLMVLEVNANCSLGSDAYCSAGELLRIAGKTMPALLPLLIQDAHRRWMESDDEGLRPAALV